jgi:methylisocitrate lyase
VIHEKAQKLRALMEEDDIFLVPEFADYASAKAAEINGFKVTMISSGDLSGGQTGIPDLQLLSLDEFVWVTERICARSPMPLIVDADDGFGGRPLNTYYGAQKIMHAGAAGILVIDGAALGRQGVLPIDEACLRFKAARDGLEDGYLVARVDVNPLTDFNEAMERSLAYREAGADMICILWMHRVPMAQRLDLVQRIAAVDKGPKWYPDITSENGQPEFDIDKDLKPLGYKLVGVHFSAHAAMLAMLDTGRHVFESRSNVYVNEHYKYTGFNFMTSMAMYDLSNGYWPSIERKYVKDPEDAIAVRNAAYFVRPEDKY